VSETEPYSPDRSLKGKLRRRWARVTHRRPLRSTIDRPIVSITFDDAPISAVRAGAEVLERHAARGTYYVCAGLADRPGHMGDYAAMGDYADLSVRGHEIACHTYSHLDCGKATGPAMVQDIDRNAGVLRDFGLETAHFAFPYGDVSPNAKRVLSGRYGSLRALHPGLVRAGTDLNQLPAVGIEGHGGEATARRWIDRALSAPAWLILYTHDVRSGASDWGCTLEALDRLLTHAVAHGAEIAPVGRVLSRLERPL